MFSDESYKNLSNFKAKNESSDVVINKLCIHYIAKCTSDVQKF